jgi:lipoprotein-anchoring transpeptidase ErfK/SrfK
MPHQHRRFLIAAIVAASAAIVMPAHSQPLAMAEPDEPAPVYRQIFPERYAPGAYAPRPSREQAVEPDATNAAMPARLRRQIVDYPTREAPGTIVIDTPNTYLYYVLGGGRAVRYGIGVGREGFTWSGVRSIARKQEWPDWHPPAEMIERQPYLPRFMAGGPGNPLGARAMYLGGTLYRIHGTSEPSTIGKHVSSGCIRMLNEDAIDLFDRTPVGTKVVVLPDDPRRARTSEVRTNEPARQRLTRVERPMTDPPPAAAAQPHSTMSLNYGSTASRLY